MKILQKVITAFALISILSSENQNIISTMQVKAVNEESGIFSSDMFYEGANGEALPVGFGSTYLVITNKNGLLHLEEPLYSVHTVSPLESFDKLSEEILQEMCEADSFFADILKCYDRNSINVYTMTAHKEYKNSEDTLIRNLCVSNADVYQAVKISSSSISSYFWDGGASFYPTDAVREKMNEGQNFFEMYSEIVGADSPLINHLKKYEDWKSRYDSWASAVDFKTMTAEEVTNSRKNAGVESDYEMLQYAFDLCTKFANEYPDIVIAAEPSLSERFQITSDFSTVSLWEHIGDLDGDDSVTASDAAAILVAAAENGTGNSTSLSDESQEFADVNADGVFNAEDAAIILKYAANQGTGTPLTLEEFILTSNK